MMRTLSLPGCCFSAAILCGAAAVLLGIVMGVSEDHLMVPVHAHLNLIGWVSLMLVGLYQRGVGRRPRALDWVQATLHGIGSMVFAAGLAVLLAGFPAARPIVIAGSLMVLAAFILFAVILMRDGAIWRREAAE